MRPIRQAWEDGGVTAIWAHRGACAYAPENTLPAFELSIEMKADGVDLDVQRTADGQLVVIHDETINRTSNGVGRVVDLTFDEIRRCDFTNGFVGRRNVKIPTLQEVLELFRPTGLTVNIELKNDVELYPRMEFDVLQAVTEMGMVDQVNFTSFNHYSLAGLRGKVAPEQLGLVLGSSLFEPWSYAKWFGAGAINPRFTVLQQPDLVWLSHEAGIKVHTWTVNKDEDAQRLAELGVDAIITNFPDRVGDAVRHPGWYS